MIRRLSATREICALDGDEGVSAMAEHARYFDVVMDKPASVTSLLSTGSLLILFRTIDSSSKAYNSLGGVRRTDWPDISARIVLK